MDPFTTLLVVFLPVDADAVPVFDFDNFWVTPFAFDWDAIMEPGILFLTAEGGAKSICWDVPAIAEWWDGTPDAAAAAAAAATKLVL